MLISLTWIRDFVDLPEGVDPHELAERFTVTTAEVDEVSQVTVDARGLIAAKVKQVSDLPDTRNLRHVVVDVGGGRTFESVTTAPVIPVGANVIYAPPGASVRAFGEIVASTVAGQSSEGMILPGEALGIPMAVQEAIFLPNTFAAGEVLPAALFNDWLIEVDNKSITHRPDLWGHFGIAREIAAMYGLPLRPYPVVPIEELMSPELPTFDIAIADARACPRYSGICLSGVPTQPAPLWMQLRLGHVGLRPISGLVDLTNYIMIDLGQPMHAFDADKVNRIEVDWAKESDVFTTLDGMERNLTASDLMIQCGGRSIALAGVMGGLETEVTDNTTTLLLESANFEPATIRRTATRLGLRTDASARFEKSLDPANTALGIQRFLQLARDMYPNMTLASRFSDAFPSPPEPITVDVTPRNVRRTLGQDIPLKEASRILTPLGFGVAGDKNQWRVRVPSFRATGDVSIEADVTEEIARYVGYGSIEPEMPRVTMRRFEPNALHELEQRTVEYFTSVHGYNEIHGYLWYDAAWLAQIGVDPGSCLELANPSAEGLHLLRRSIMPGLLAATAKNRFHFSSFGLCELGSVFEADRDDAERRHIGLVSARRGKKGEDELLARLKGTVEAWAWQRFRRQLTFGAVEPDADRPWEHPHRTASVAVGDHTFGRLSVIDAALRRTMDEHLSAWSIAWAELALDELVSVEPGIEVLGGIPPYPLVEIDFSFCVPAATRYAEAARALGGFEHPLLKHLRYVGSYEGASIGAGQRSLTVRAVLGDDTRTLVEQDVADFRAAFGRHLEQCGYQERG